MLPLWLAPTQPRRILVVGCGPGDELVALAHAFPAAEIHGIDPSVAMVAAAVARCDEAKVSSRVTVQVADVGGDVPRGCFDAVVSLFVAHLVRDDGARASFYEGLARAARPGGVVLNAELEHGGATDALLVHCHLEHGREHGLGDDRLSLVHTRLRFGFHRLTTPRRHELFRSSHLRRPERLLEHATVVVERASYAGSRAVAIDYRPRFPSHQ